MSENKRTVLTPAERVAKLEAELAAARERAAARSDKIVEQLKAKRATLVEQINERVEKIATIDTELWEHGIDLEAGIGTPESEDEREPEAASA